MSSLRSDPRRGILIFVVAAVVMGGIIAGGIAINRANNSSIATSATPPPAAATPTGGVAGSVPFADCSAATFGAPLAPQDAPADPHRYTAAPAAPIDTGKLYQATIATARGPIVLCLQPSLAPETVRIFVDLARNRFFDGLAFHRVEPDFVIQGGDPEGTGQGGPGFQFNDEPVRQQYVDGAVAMANSGTNTNGSQFFIDIADDSAKLEPKYNLFGRVQSGLDVAKQIAKGDVMTTVTVAAQR